MRNRNDVVRWKMGRRSKKKTKQTKEKQDLALDDIVFFLCLIDDNNIEPTTLEPRPTPKAPPPLPPPPTQNPKQKPKKKPETESKTCAECAWPHSAVFDSKKKRPQQVLKKNRFKRFKRNPIQGESLVENLLLVFPLVLSFTQFYLVLLSLT